MKLVISGDKVHVTRTPESELSGEDDNCDAIMEFHSSTIRLRDDATGDGYMRILCHEITHHRLAWCGMSAVLKIHDDTGQLEEAMCDSMGSMLYEIIRDNPELVSEIAKIRDGNR